MKLFSIRTACLNAKIRSEYKNRHKPPSNNLYEFITNCIEAKSMAGVMSSKHLANQNLDSASYKNLANQNLDLASYISPRT